VLTASSVREQCTATQQQQQGVLCRRSNTISKDQLLHMLPAAVLVPQQMALPVAAAAYLFFQAVAAAPGKLGH
jgi:hypothetical protein